MFGGLSMRAVNFIADPWEWPNPVSYLDRQWLRNYGFFRTRLHWLLLWYDEVWIQDSFAIYNRQFERWFETARLGSISQQRALADLFGKGAVQVPIRQRSGQSFSCVAEVYNRDMRNNADYIWYYDGWPKDTFFKHLDSYLASKGPLFHYDGKAVPTKLESAFNAVMEPIHGLEDLYNEGSELREEFQPGYLKEFREMVGEGSNWRRSFVYRLLGIGIDNSGGQIAGALDIPNHLKSHIQRLIDVCAYHAVDLTLGIPTRFPRNTPLTPYYDLYSPTQKQDHLCELTDLLQNLDVGAIAFEGDILNLFQRFSKLKFEEVYRLRESTCFTEYRRMYRELEDKGQASKEKAFLVSVAKQALACLSKLGNYCGVEVKEASRSTAVVRWLSEPVGSKLMATGLGIVLGGAVSFATFALNKDLLNAMWAGARAAIETVSVVQPTIIWLTVSIQPVGNRQRPIPVRLTYAGGGIQKTG